MKPSLRIIASLIACLSTLGIGACADDSPVEGTSAPVSADRPEITNNAVRNVQAYRGSILHTLRDPNGSEAGEAYQYFEDGALLVMNGVIANVGPAELVLRGIPKDVIHEYSNSLIIPGFVDTHVEFQQASKDAPASPSASQVPDENLASAFLDRLLQAGTTTALVYSSADTGSVNTLMQEAYNRNMRLVTGKVLTEASVPRDLNETPDKAYANSTELIDKWHKNGRLLYAITSRFSSRTSLQDLKTAQKLAARCPDCNVHADLTAHVGQRAWSLDVAHYASDPGISPLGVYDFFGLMTSRTVFAHASQLDDADYARLRALQSALSLSAVTPCAGGQACTDFGNAERAGVKTGLGTDYTGTDRFSNFEALNQAHRAITQQGAPFSALKGFYLATLGSAHALELQNQLGNLDAGKEADFVVLDLEANAGLKVGVSQAQSVEDKLLALMTKADKRVVRATNVAGKHAHDRDANPQD